MFLTSTELQSGETVDFGATQTGTSVLRTVTVTNVGDANLSLSPIDPSTLPAGFSLVSDLGSLTLAPGQSTTFTLQFNAAAAGTFSGVLHLLNGDADEGSFNLTLQGTAHAIRCHHCPRPRPPRFKRSTTARLDSRPPAIGTARQQGRLRARHSVRGKSREERQNGCHRDLDIHRAGGGPIPHRGHGPHFTLLCQRCAVLGIRRHDASAHRASEPKKWQGRLHRRRHGRWENLGSFTIRGNTLVVQLTNRANGHVVADAVRIEQVMPSPDPPSCDSHQHDDKDHDKGDVSHQDDKGPHKSAPSHRPAPTCHRLRRTASRSRRRSIRLKTCFMIWPRMWPIITTPSRISNHASIHACLWHDASDRIKC